MAIQRRFHALLLVLLCGSFAVPLQASDPRAVPEGHAGVFVFPTPDFRVQRLNPAGVPMWDAGGLPVTGESQSVTSYSYAEDGRGGVLVAWATAEEGSDAGPVFVQRLSAAGARLWTANGVAVARPAVGLAGFYDTSVVSDGAGGAIAFWHRADSPGDLRAQRVSASGDLLWAAEGVAVDSNRTSKFQSRVIPDGRGGAIVAWVDARNGNTDIRAQRLDGSGRLLWSQDGLLVCGDPRPQQDVAIVTDGAGGAIVAWSDYRGAQAGSFIDVYAQRLNDAGLAQWTPDGVAVCALANRQVSPQAFPDGQGGAIIVWYDDRENVNGPADRYVQRLGGDGEPRWDVDGIRIGSLYEYWGGSPDGVGGFHLLQRHDDGPEQTEFYAQHLNGEGNLEWDGRGFLLDTDNVWPWGTAPLRSSTFMVIMQTLDSQQFYGLRVGQEGPLPIPGSVQHP